MIRRFCLFLMLQVVTGFRGRRSPASDAAIRNSLLRRHATTEQVATETFPETLTVESTLTILDEELKGSPGYVSSAPMSTLDQSKKQMAKIIVSTAVLWLTLNIKAKEIFSRFNSAQVDTEVISSSSGVLRSGIQYSDKVITADGIVQKVEEQPVPVAGDEVVVVAKLFYNGLQLNKDSSNELLAFKCQSRDEFDELEGVEYVFAGAAAVGNSNKKANPSDVPEDPMAAVALNGVIASLERLRYGVVRKVVIPSPLAFGDRGLSPFVPPGASVMYELTMSKKQ